MMDWDSLARWRHGTGGSLCAATAGDNRGSLLWVCRRKAAEVQRGAGVSSARCEPDFPFQDIGLAKPGKRPLGALQVQDFITARWLLQ